MQRALQKMAKAPVELVIFDCDGVLVDSEPLSMRVLIDGLAGIGLKLSLDDGYRLFLGRSEAAMKETLKEQFQLELPDEVHQHMRLRLATLMREELQPIAGIAAVLAGLDRSSCVASSSIPERIKMSLQRTGLDNYFGERVFSATMVTRGKPAPDLFLYAARAMGVSAANCLVIEDSPAGIAAARNAGMRVFAFTGASHGNIPVHAESVRAAAADLVFDDMGRLPQLIAGL